MEDLKVYLIRYHNNGYFCKSVVLAEKYEEAEKLLLKEYEDFGVSIQIEEYEELTVKGTVLTESIKL